MALAERLAVSFQPGDLVVLTGPLGSGKTAFVKGLARGMGIDVDMVNSPTYTFVNEYKGTRRLYHFDLYRMQDISELHEIGWDDYLSRREVMVVEWGEKADGRLPERYYQIRFALVSGNEREFNISLVEPHGVS
jgi:tRNA threonylcarbamoyladenosine biosynthesis protein TsaE